MDQASFVSLRSRFVFTAAGRPLRDAVVSLAGGRIAAIDKTRTSQAAVDLGNVAILPGLINAHTHLEFSDCAAPLDGPGMPLPQWIRAVVDYRRQRSEPQHQAAVLAGLAECSRFGTTAVGEIATAGWPLEILSPGPHAALEATVFREFIGLSNRWLAGNAITVREHLALALQHPFLAGLSPHAPYTAHPELVERLAALSLVAGVPLAMHLAESPEELELLQTGAGPLQKLLVDLDAWDHRAIRPGKTPLDYLRRLRAGRRALVIHGNFLTDEEIAFVGAAAGQMAVVYCPRTHAYFGHPPYPLEKLLAAGAVVALGTDSRASNPDLNLLAEMRESPRGMEFPPSGSSKWPRSTAPRRSTAIENSAALSAANGPIWRSSACRRRRTIIPMNCSSTRARSSKRRFAAARSWPERPSPSEARRGVASPLRRCRAQSRGKNCTRCLTAGNS